MRTHEKNAVLKIAADELKSVLSADNVPSMFSPPGDPLRSGHYDKKGAWVNTVSMPVVLTDNEGDIHEVLITLTYQRRH